MADYTSTDPTKNIFAYGGNMVDAQTGALTPVANPRTGVINSSALTPTTPVGFQEPAVSPVPGVGTLDAQLEQTYQLSPTEQGAQDLISRIQGLTGETVGEAQFRSEQEQAQGLPGFLQQQKQLSAQLKALQNRAQAIPLEIQQESIGRGRTAGGVAPLQTARLRENAIEALTTSSLLEATRGNIELANNLVDRAVSAKYDPIREQIQANLANLELIMRSPAYGQAEKRRAQAQADIQSERQRRLEEQQENSKIIMSWAAAALQNGATPFQAQRIAQIARSNNPDLGVAFGLFSPFATNPQAAELALLNLQAKRLDVEASRRRLELSTAQAAKIYNDIRLANKKGVPPVVGSSYVTERNARISSSLDELMDRVNVATVGLAGQLSFVPGSPARDFKADLETLKANISFSELQAMREASKTGGALGQVAVRELELLESTLGALDQGQSPANFKKNLAKIKASLDRWYGQLNQSSAATVNDPASQPVGSTFIYNGARVKKVGENNYEVVQ